MSKQTMLFDARAITIKPCGVRNVAENYLNEFSRDYKIAAIVHPGMENLIPPGIRCIYFKEWLSRFNPISDFLISYYVLKLRPGLYFSPHAFLPFLAVLPRKRIFICHDLFAALDKNFFKKKGLLAPFAQMYFRIFSELSMLRASHVVTPSKSIHNSLSGLIFKPKKSISIHNGINLSENSASLDLNNKQILFVGNFRSYKGFDLLYTAWENLLKLPISNDWRIIVVTNESVESINSFLLENKKLKNIKFLSRITNAELSKIRSETKVCVIPSRSEGFGIPLLESIQSKSTILCSNIEVFTEIAKEFANYPIVQFQADSANDLMRKLESLMGEVNLGVPLDIYKEAIDTLSKNFSWKKAAVKFKNFCYED
jgi:glycosyltransferase involved in cell wall biosynthesis